MSFFGNALSKSKKRKELRLILQRLRPALGRRFGKHDAYTPEQVAEAMEFGELLLTGLRYGVCLYCTREDYDAWSKANGERDYWATRTELAEHVFDGNLSFTENDVRAVVASLNPPSPEGGSGSSTGVLGSGDSGGVGGHHGGF